MIDNRGNSWAKLALLTLLWGSSFLWIKVALRGLSPVQVVFARMALGALVLVVVVHVRHLRLPVNRRVWAHLAVAALVANIIPYTLFAFGEQTVDSAVAGTMNATTPLWTLLVAFAAGSQRHVPTPRLAGFLLGCLGSLVVLTPWRSGMNGSLGGALLCLAAAASYGVSYVYQGRYLTNRGLPPLVLACGQMLTATMLAAILLPLAGHQPVHLSWTVVGSVAVLGAFGTGVAYVLNFSLIATQGGSAASTVTYLLPIVSVTLGAFILGEPLTGNLVIGAAVVLAGVWQVQRKGSAH